MRLSLPLTCFLLVAPAGARAQDRFEIQVYEAEVNAPWQASLQLHLNYTVIGESLPQYEGETPPDRAARFTLEPALGITEFFEVGAYLQAVTAPGYDFKWAGVKLRTLFVVPRRLSGAWDFGLNLEVSYVPKAAEQAPWATELRPIIGWRSKWVGVWINPILGWSLSGPGAFRPELTPAARSG